MRANRGVRLLGVRSVRCDVLERLNRFTVRVVAPDGESLAHLNNTGRLLEYLDGRSAAYCVRRSAPGRTSYRLLAFDDEGGAALVDTLVQMRSLEVALGAGLLPWAAGCSISRRSPRLGGSTLDYLMECRSRAHPARVYVEVKSAVMRGPGGAAMYPDCPTERGRRQISDMIRSSLRGIRSMIIFVAALPGVTHFSPNASGDPKIPGLLRRAASAGIEIRAVSMH
ncbi:MAG: DNA/RNA nuclease SfsA, partial [Conexivisphaera sp.]